MTARLIFREKHLLPDGAIVEMVLWRLPEMTRTQPHGIKYRLYWLMSRRRGGHTDEKKDQH